MPSRMMVRVVAAAATVCALTLAVPLGASAATENIEPTTTVTVPRPAAVAVDPIGETYVVAADENAVYVFDLEGNRIRLLAGASTQLSAPIGMTVDASRNLYVTNLSTNSIAVFPPDADGDVAPSRVISGVDTGLSGVRGVAVDAAGRIFATNFNANSITVYAPDAVGNAVPIRTISGSQTGLSAPYDIDLIGGVLFVANLNNSITEYDAAASGDHAPLRAIVGPATLLDAPLGIGVDEFGNVYAGNYNTDSVTVYAPLADGDSAPIRVLAGIGTGISGPGGLTVDDAGTIFVSNANSYTMTSYAKAPTITGITVSTGTTDGGTVIDLTGTGFSGGVRATVGGVPAAVDIVNSTAIHITTGAHPPGVVDIVVTTRGGVVTLPGAFTFVTSADPEAPRQLAASGADVVGSVVFAAVLVLSGALLMTRWRRGSSARLSSRARRS